MSHRVSYWKTLLAAAMALLLALAALASLVWVFFSTTFAGILLEALWAVTALVTAAATGWLALLVLGGIIALRRDRLEAAGQPYVDARRRESVSAVIPALVSLVRQLIGRLRGDECLYLRPGEVVEVKSADAIRRSLDARGTRGGLPFMPEMTRYCGHRFRVLRRVERLNDWIHKSGPRRMHGIVLLEGPRCDGSFHGGCQANCHLRWHEAWLTRAGPRVVTPAAAVVPAGLPVLRVEPAGARYVCQATELTAGSRPLRKGDPRAYLREWLVGNVRLRPWLVGASLAAFRWVQLTRGGAPFPWLAPEDRNDLPRLPSSLRPGDLVRVRSKREIERTLDQSMRNRGLYFDGEMLRHCGGTYAVRARLEQLIVERTGRLVTLKNPTVILEGATATGEYVAFNPENEHIFWREAWLERLAGPTVPTPSGTHQTAKPAKEPERP